MGLFSVKPLAIARYLLRPRPFGRRRFPHHQADGHRCGARRLSIQALERRDLLTAQLGPSEHFFSPAPTVLPAFSPANAIALTTPAADYLAEEAEDRYPESSDPLLDLAVAASPLTNDDTFKLHSHPGSNYTIYLDFDGGITEGTSWNTSTGIETLVDIAYDRNGDPASFSTSELSEIRNIWKLVAEDFAPFDVDVTTEDPGLDALTKSGSSDTTWGVRSLHTTNTNGVCNGCGGIAYIGSFSSALDLPIYAFNKGVVAGGNTLSHEVGHSIRLGHDGISGGATYYSGHGSGATAWGPIMGGTSAKTLKTWSNGDYYNASNQQDDLDVITTQNGFSYRADDHGNAFATASPLEISSANQLSGFGVIEQSNDIDLFSFWTDAGNVSFVVDPYLDHPNLDLWAGIYDSSGALVAESNPPDQVSASFSDLTLASGKYYLRVEGVGSHGVYNPALDKVFDPGEPGYTGPEDEPPWSVQNPIGYSDYASVGQYWITGTRAVATSELISIQAVDSQKFEGDTGISSFTFEVSRSGAVEPELQVAYAVLPMIPDADSTRSLPTIDASDFAAGSIPTGWITIPAEQDSSSLVIEVAGDTAFERDESFRVVIFDPPAGWMIANSTADGVILSDETAVGIATVNTAMSVQPEGDLNSGATYSFQLQRLGDLGVSTTAQWEVQYSGLENPASDLDFAGGVRPSGQVVFDPGIAEIEISIELAGDLDVELDENFLVVVTAVSGENITLIDPASASRRAIIQEDESPVTVLSQVQFRWRQIRNGDGDRDAWAIDNVSLSTSMFQDDFDPDIDSPQWESISNGSVNSDGSIFPGSNGQELLMRGTGDRIATSMPLQPGPGATLSFDLIIGNGTGTSGNGADNAEAGKDVWLEFSVDGQHWDVLKKMDTDSYETWKSVVVDLPERAFVTPAAISEGDSGTNSMAFSIVRSGNLEKTASVDWQVVPAGSFAIDVSDLDLATFPSGTVSFAVDDDVETVAIPILGDPNLEADETFDLIVTFSNAGPVTGGARTGVILNDDEPGVESVIVNDGSIQRSAIRKVEVHFDGLVEVSPDAFSLTNLGTDASPTSIPVDNLIVNMEDQGAFTKVTLSLPNGESLSDGNYRLDIDSAKITARFGGWAMSNDYSFGDQAVDNFYRKYGDVNGNRSVDLLDFAEFRRAFGLSDGQPNYLDALDSDEDGTIGLLDFAKFRSNFGT